MGRTSPSFCSFAVGADPHGPLGEQLGALRHLNTDSLHQKVAVYTLPSGTNPAPSGTRRVNLSKVSPGKGVARVARTSGQCQEQAEATDATVPGAERGGISPVLQLGKASFRKAETARFPSPTEK